MGAVSRKPRRAGAHLHNEDVAAAFEEMAELLAISGESTFRVRAYQRAAQVIRTLSRPLSEFRGAEELEELPGIGEDLAAKIQELLRSGSLQALERLRRKVPAGLRELLGLPGLGPVRVRALFSSLGVRSAADLRRAIEQGRLEHLRGFGAGLQHKLVQGLEARATAPRRWPWSVASEYAEPLRAYLAGLAGVSSAEVAGSYRRGRETVGDLDLLLCGGEGVDVGAALRRYPDVREVIAEGPTRCSAVLGNGMHVDVRLVPPQSAGAALYYFTGSREHSVQLRQRAVERGLKLNEYGLFRGRRRIAGEDEAQILKTLGLHWIAPELRERRGEIEAAERGELPRLIELSDLQGDLHAHTDASDGHDSLAQMAQAAQAHGLQYLAITDHSRYLGITRGLDAGRLARQIEQIEKLNAAQGGVTLLKGIEVDILEDGRLALPDELLARLDVVVASIHSHFELSEAKQTARILRAFERPYLTILAHPTGRLLGERPGYALDFERVFQAAHDRPCYLELNAQPLRLDLDDVHCQAARAHGVLLSIDSDAHSGTQLDNLRGGIRQARRGWLGAADVLNARPLAQLQTLLARTRRGSRREVPG